MIDPVLADLKRAADKEKAAFFPRFFKTGKGQYGEGDVFIGVTVPKQRLIAKKHRNIPLTHVKKLLNSPIHEVRLCALLILVSQYQRGNEKKRQTVVDFYLKNFEYVNNWDLVDSSAPHILGRHLLETKSSTAILDRFATSKHLWTQRISIVATQAFIRGGELEHTFRISETGVCTLTQYPLHVVGDRYILFV